VVIVVAGLFIFFPSIHRATSKKDEHTMRVGSVDLLVDK
jgi:hypothetical protein